jgi:hypothetical protein
MVLRDIEELPCPKKDGNTRLYRGACILWYALMRVVGNQTKLELSLPPTL